MAPHARFRLLFTLSPLVMLTRFSFFALLLAFTLTACTEADTTTVETTEPDVTVVDPVEPMETDDVMLDDEVTAQSTLDAVTAAGGLTDLAPGAAVANIDAWIAKLDGMDGTSGVVDGLRTLKTQLTAETLDGNAIGETLMSLGEQTTAVAGDNEALGTLGGALTSAGETLTGM